MNMKYSNVLKIIRRENLSFANRTGKTDI